MRPLHEQNHYELLEIQRDASADEIERTYRLARSTFAEGSMAGLPVFEEGDLPLIREHLDTAYRVLSDAESRRAYDAELDAGSGVEPKEPAAALPTSAASTLEDLDDQGGDFDGSRLQRLRMHRGVEIEDIARTTKINPTYLRFIEDERFEDLPAAVYVRGFVMSYASCVGLPPRRVADSYMERYEASHHNPKRGLFARS